MQFYYSIDGMCVAFVHLYEFPQKRTQKTKLLPITETLDIDGDDGMEK